MEPTYDILRDEALADLKNLMDSLPEGTGKKLAYWLKAYAKYLGKEKSFDPNKLIRYKRGSVVKVDFGFNIGSEEGGVHYAVVIDKKNAMGNPVLTVVPLTSVKETTDLSKLRNSQIFLGEVIYESLKKNLDDEINKGLAKLDEMSADAAKRTSTEKDADTEYQKRFKEEAKYVNKIIHRCKLMNAEIEKMKRGSIALVGQITTVSKMRIIDPIFSHDVLSKVRVGDDLLIKIDQKIEELMIGEARSEPAQQAESVEKSIRETIAVK